MKKTFYYQFNRLNGWFIFNAVFSIIMVYGTFRCSCLLYWWQMQVLYATLAFSWLVWGYKYLLKHPMTMVDDDGITIDHCRLLRWADIKGTEEKTIRCGFRKCRIMVLHPKEGIDYHYNFLQKHNCGFTAFSIPLYGIVRPEDIEEITAIIDEKIKATPKKD